MSLKILHVGEHGFPNSAPKVHSEQFCLALRRRGHWVDTENGVLTRRFPSRLLESVRVARHLYRRISANHYDLIYLRETWLDPFRSILLKSLSIPSVIEVNGLVLKELELDGARPWLRWLAKCSQASNLRAATGVVTACQAWAAVLRRDYGLKNIDVLQNGVDLTKFRPNASANPRATFKLDPRATILGFVGTLGRYYEFRPLLQCIREMSIECPLLKIVVVGSGPQRENLANLVKQLQVEDLVSIHDPVPHEEVPAIIQAFDIALLPAAESRIRDTGGVLAAMKLAEYCAVGKPILRVDYPGSDSYSILEPFSWAVTPQIGYRECLRSILRQRDQWPGMGLAARAFAENHLSWDASALRLESLLDVWLSR